MQLVCTTPPGDAYGQLLVRVQIASVDVQAYATCVGSCTFSYDQGVTPTVSWYSIGASFNSVINIAGYLRGEYAVCHVMLQSCYLIY